MICSTLRKFNPTLRGVLKRCMSDHRTFPMQPSKYQWRKCKDLMNFYILLGVIPLTVITCLTYIFVGPATLTEIPEDYTPKHWEYCRNPITRVIARYIMPDPQQEYEKYLHFMFEESERATILYIDSLIKKRMEEHCDYQAFYYRPVLAKYFRVQRYNSDYLQGMRGD